MAITNKDKDKNPVLAEIENDNTPLDAKGNPILTTNEPSLKLEDLLTKDPSTLGATEMDFLSENKDELTDEQKATFGLIDESTLGPQDDSDDIIKIEPTTIADVLVESQDQKDQRYRAQQSEAQIQVERNKALTDRVDEAAKLPDPTIDELKSFVRQDGVEWDELTTFEQGIAKRSLLNEKRFQLVNESVQETKKLDEWANKVDTFIDSTDSKPEYIDLSSHEADFRKFAMKESHRGTPIDILLGAFLHSLPPEKKTRSSLFETQGGGEKTVVKSGITDADTVAKLRMNDPKEYSRQVRAGKIKIEI